jgi:hypothetical protein
MTRTFESPGPVKEPLPQGGGSFLFDPDGNQRRAPEAGNAERLVDAITGDRRSWHRVWPDFGIQIPI